MVTAPVWRATQVLPYEDGLRAAAALLNAGERVALDREPAMRGTKP